MSYKLESILENILKFAFHFFVVILSVKLFLFVFTPFHELVHAIFCISYGGEIKEIDWQSHVLCSFEHQYYKLGKEGASKLLNSFIILNAGWEIASFIIIFSFGLWVACYSRDKLWG